MNLPQKHSVTGTNIFSVMSGLATQYNAINLSQGFPDFALDEHLSKLLYDAACSGYNQYAPMPGLPVLRQAIAKDFKNRYNITVDADTEITITPGATYAIYTAFTAILLPGVFLLLLFFDNRQTESNANRWLFRCNFILLKLA